MIEAILRWIRKEEAPKARETVYRAFGPPLFPPGHSCMEEPFPWRIAAQTRHQLLRPCPSCGHAVAAHTYDGPCPLCILERDLYAFLNSRKR